MRLRGIVVLCAALAAGGCAQRQGAATVPVHVQTAASVDSQFAALMRQARANAGAPIPALGSRMVDYRAVFVPKDVAVWARAKYHEPSVLHRSSTGRSPVGDVTYLQMSAARAAASVRRVSDSTCWYLLTFTIYDDGTSELTRVRFLGCVGDGGGGAGDNGGGGGGDVAIAPDKPANAGCGSARQTAGNAMKAIFDSMPGIPNGTTQQEAYSYIYSDGAGGFFWDSIQTISLDANGHGTPRPPTLYPGYPLVGFVHTHPGGSQVDNLDDETKNTHFSESDFTFATSFNPPIAMYLGMVDSANHFYELQYTQTGVDAQGNPTYKVTGETPAVGVSTAGC